MKPKLVLCGDYDDYGWAIGWNCGDGEGINLYIGQAPHLLSLEERPGNDDDDVWAAERSLAVFMQKHPGVAERAGNYGPWVFSAKTKAQEALRWVRAEVNQVMNPKIAPLQEWEKQALAAGWKPPKGRL